MKKILMFILVFTIFSALTSAEIVKNGETIDSPLGELSVNLYNKEDGFTASIRNNKFRAVLDVGECKIFELYNVCLKKLMIMILVKK